MKKGIKHEIESMGSVGDPDSPLKTAPGELQTSTHEWRAP